MPSLTREEKFATTKLAILRSLIIRIETEPLESISVKDICHDSNIATATFFLYFPHKTSILDYFIQLWGVEISWWMERYGRHLGPKEALAGMFDYAGLRAEQHPRMIAEVISWMARRREETPTAPLTPAELALAFPGNEGIESVTQRSLSSILADLLKNAKLSGAIAEEVEIEPALLALISILFSTPPLVQSMGAGRVRQWYTKQLAIIWAGLERQTNIS